jgi:5-methylcytosine-specific restriction protein A
MNDRFGILRHRQFPKIGERRAQRDERPRGNSTKRGYDHLWSKVSTRFRQGHPFCRFCEQKGFDATPAEVVDHILPIVDRPDLRLTVSNLQSLCGPCHGCKGRLEAYAREHDMLDMLPEWCANPESRPRKLRR